MSQRNPYDFDKIPDFAMQPARDDIDGFDPTIYERLLAEAEKEAEEMMGSGPKAEESGVSAEVDLQIKQAVEEAIAEVKKEPEIVPVSVAPTVAPVTKLEPEPETEAEEVSVGVVLGDVVSAGDSVMTDSMKLMDMIPNAPIRVYVEEDILVPDVKPDLASILSMDGKLRFSEKGSRINGELLLQILYIPEGKGADHSIVAIESRLPFQQEIGFAAEETSKLKAVPVIEALDYTVINERKCRVKAVISVSAREYRDRKLELFEGLKDDEVQLLKEKLHLTDVALQTSDHLELEEDFLLSEAFPEIGKILRYDVNLVENHKQISKEKVVISGTAYCNIMYLPKEVQEGKTATEATGSGEVATGSGVVPAGAEGETLWEPVLYQGKSEFTQFIRLQDGWLGGALSGGRTAFQPVSVMVSAKESESGQRNSFKLSVEAETFVELYKDIEKEIVTDVYHHRKEMVFDKSEIDVMSLCVNGTAEVSARDVVAVPDRYDSVDRVAFISGNIGNVETKLEDGKNVTEGNVTVKLICISGDEKRTPFSMKQDIPFRAALELPTIPGQMIADNEVVLKELRFDKLNSRQIEVNATVLVNGAIISRAKYPLIKNIGFAEVRGKEAEHPGFVLYVTNEQDTIWKIAKKYRTTIGNIEKINGIELNHEVRPGTKLLIVK